MVAFSHHSCLHLQHLQECWYNDNIGFLGGKTPSTNSRNVELLHCIESKMGSFLKSLPSTTFYREKCGPGSSSTGRKMHPSCRSSLCCCSAALRHNFAPQQSHVAHGDMCLSGAFTPVFWLLSSLAGCFNPDTRVATRRARMLRTGCLGLLCHFIVPLQHREWHAAMGRRGFGSRL